MDDTVTLTFVVTGLGFVLCNVFIACHHQFRNKEGRRAEYEPESVKMESWLTILTTVGVAAMLAPGLFIWKDVVTPPDDAMELGAGAMELVLPAGRGWPAGCSGGEPTTEDNPLGIDPSIPLGRTT